MSANDRRITSTKGAYIRFIKMHPRQRHVGNVEVSRPEMLSENTVEKRVQTTRPKI